MATVLLSAAGAALGSGFGGTVLGLSGSVIGRTVGATVGRSIDQRILGSGSDAVEVGKVERFRVSGAGYGAPLREVWGRVRVAGDIIWASRFSESRQSTGGGKGAARATTTTFSYSVSIAVALCLGKATCIGRIWADGVEIAKNSLNLRFYPGSEDQLPDPKIEAVEGTGFAASYRGICYVVIEDLPLGRFGNRVPQFSFEVIRVVDGPEDGTVRNLRQTIKAVALIPGSGEYALATTPVHFDISPGRVKTANVHSLQDVTDFALSLDHLTDELPNCKAVSLVVSWFGSDLRCGHCVIQPKVEQSAEDAAVMPWRVSGVGRQQAAVVPHLDGRPVYGGTPTDQSVVEAIQALRESGKEVMFYPFILMDQLEGNALPDPWSDAEQQPVLPWRGRMSLDKAPGRAGTTDQTSAAELELATFLGAATVSDFTVTDEVQFARPADWGYRRFILHYAHLCALAGGVESFCLGSELRGLTQIRGGAGDFLMVQALRSLAAEVKQILGAGTKISYAADWSEYFGYHVNEDIYFNLDPLWADSNIDFIGIDNYMPISDWRDDVGHKDADWASIYDQDYLVANIAGGEGFDWFYENSEMAEIQIRKPIKDLQHGEDWVYRYKDLQGWWTNEHRDRISGIRSETPTDWTPGMKPFRFTEYGCAAMDKATNQPNKFLDPKSSESELPRGSNGGRDDAIQLHYYDAMAVFWGDTANNPIATSYEGTMVDFSHSYAWAWDARPFPEFPGNREVWADASSYYLGHWLNGRSSGQPLSALVANICGQSHSQVDLDVSGLTQVVKGYESASTSSLRSKLQPLMVSWAVDAIEREGILIFCERGDANVTSLSSLSFARSASTNMGLVEVRGAEEYVPTRIAMTFILAENDFEVETLESSFIDGSAANLSQSEVNLLLTGTEAQSVVERWSLEAFHSNETCKFALTKSFAHLSVGCIVEIERKTYRVERIEEANELIFDGTCVEIGSYYGAVSSVDGPQRSPAVPASALFVQFMDLPLITGSENPVSPHVAVASSPWQGPVAVWSSSSAADFTLNTNVTVPAIVGTLQMDLFRSPSAVWDRSSRLRVQLSYGTLQAISQADVLNGANFAAVGDGSVGNWEVIQFSRAELIGVGLYELSDLLRGVSGTDALAPDVWPVGSTFIQLDRGAIQIDLPASSRGLDRTYRVGVSERGYTDSRVVSKTLSFSGSGLRPWSICHLEATNLIDSSLLVKWTRRARIDGDTWQSYEVPLSEEMELYVISIVSDGVKIREVFSTSPSWIYSDEMQQQDRSGNALYVSVAQISSQYGPGPASVIQV